MRPHRGLKGMGRHKKLVDSATAPEATSSLLEKPAQEADEGVKSATEPPAEDSAEEAKEDRMTLGIRRSRIARLRVPQSEPVCTKKGSPTLGKDFSASAE